MKPLNLKYPNRDLNYEAITLENPNRGLDHVGHQTWGIPVGVLSMIPQTWGILRNHKIWGIEISICITKSQYLRYPNRDLEVSKPWYWPRIDKSWNIQSGILIMKSINLRYLDMPQNLRYPGRDLDHEPSTLAVSLLGSWPRSLKIWDISTGVLTTKP